MTDASLMTVHLARSAFKALSNDSPQKRSTVITERGGLVRVGLKAMGHVDIESLLLRIGINIRHGLVCTRAVTDHQLVTLLVKYAIANLALITLLAKTPNKLMAMGAVSRLLEEASHELVAIDLVDLLALQSTATLGGSFGFHECTIGRISFLEDDFHAYSSCGLQIEP